MADAIETSNLQNENPIIPATHSIPAPTESSKPAGKVWSDDYVKELREEAKSRRLINKTYEDALRSVLHIGEQEDIGDLNKRISDFAEANKKALDEANAKVNNYIINAELTKLMGSEYDEKLTRKCLDLSGVTVNDGVVTGLKEALEAAVAEYPAIKKTTVPNYASGTGTSQTAQEKDADAEAITNFRKALGLS